MQQDSVQHINSNRYWNGDSHCYMFNFSDFTLNAEKTTVYTQFIQVLPLTVNIHKAITGCVQRLPYKVPYLQISL